VSDNSKNTLKPVTHTTNLSDDQWIRVGEGTATHGDHSSIDHNIQV
jgi:hypothetical protein